MTPLIGAMHSVYPQAKVDVLVLSGNAPLLEDDTRIHHVYVVKGTSAAGVVSAVHLVRKQRYDLAVVVSPGVRNTLLGLFSGARYASGYLASRFLKPYFFQDHVACALGTDTKVYYNRFEHIYVRAVKSAFPVGVVSQTRNLKPCLAQAPETVAKHLGYLKAHGQLRDGAINMVLHPSANWEMKRWPDQRWIELLSKLHERLGDRLNATLIGLPRERMMLKRIQRAVNYKIHALVGWDLRPAMVLISQADLFLGVDSGPKHIAAALGCPVVELLGPSMPATVGAASRSLYHNVGCNPCVHHHCLKDGACMKAISVDEVVESVFDVI